VIDYLTAVCAMLY